MKKILLACCIAALALPAAHAQTQTRSHHGRSTTGAPASTSTTTVTTDLQPTGGTTPAGSRKSDRPHRMSNPGTGAGTEMRNGTESVGPLGNGAGGSTIGSTNTNDGSTGNGTNTYNNGSGTTTQPATGTTATPATGR